MKEKIGDTIRATAIYKVFLERALEMSKRRPQEQVKTKGEKGKHDEQSQIVNLQSPICSVKSIQGPKEREEKRRGLNA